MKNKKIIKFLRFLKENNESRNFKSFFYDKKSIAYRKRRFNRGIDREDISKMSLFQFLHYVNEKDAISNAFWLYDVVPPHNILRWVIMNDTWRYEKNKF